MMFQYFWKKCHVMPSAPGELSLFIALTVLFISASVIGFVRLVFMLSVTRGEKSVVGQTHQWAEMM